MIALLLLQAAAAASAPPPAAKPDLFGTVRTVVVDAIRDCGKNKDGEILVCSKDRGFSEKERGRLRKLEKPKPVDSGAPIQIIVSNGDADPPPAYPGKP